MAFRNNLYYIDSVSRTDEGVIYTLHLNADHIIYKAHFPGEPITPGVCILQMGLELLSDAVGVVLELVGVKNVKFLSILHPEDASVSVIVHRISIDNNMVKGQVDFSFKEVAIAKMSLICQTIAK